MLSSVGLAESEKPLATRCRLHRNLARGSKRPLLSGRRPTSEVLESLGEVSFLQFCHHQGSFC